MARMSKRAFNNVVIFAMLGMIFLFNIESFMPDAKLPASTPLLPEGVFVLKIEQNTQKLERVGQQWRFKGVNQTVTTTPEQQIAAWRSAQMHIAKAPRQVVQTEPLIAVVWAAGQSQGLVYALVVKDTTLWVQFDGQWYTVVDTTLSDLLPWLPLHNSEQEM